MIQNILFLNYWEVEFHYLKSILHILKKNLYLNFFHLYLYKHLNHYYFLFLLSCIPIDSTKVFTYIAFRSIIF